MFVLFATKPLNDGTNGFRFNILGRKGLYRPRKLKSRGIGIEKLSCTTAFHLFKRTIYLEKKVNRTTSRRLRHFAG